MRVIQLRRELQARADEERARGLRLALVPTMGALHRGHLSLVAEARKRADRVCLSIFVNPTQFNDPSDYEAYPNDLDDDLEKCREAGVDVVFAPTPDQLYAEGAQTWVEVTELAESLCGATRPGHFRGVTTVVTKLFQCAKPHVAVFGEKDYQQLAVIRRMVTDLCMDIEIVGGATLREDDGLAMSSRNVHLGPQARREAPALSRSLAAAQHAVSAGERDPAVLLAAVRREIEAQPLAEIDYAELRDPDTLTTCERTLEGPALLALAVFFSPDPDGSGARVRLIDNRVLQPGSRTPQVRRTA